MRRIHSSDGGGDGAAPPRMQSAAPRVVALHHAPRWIREAGAALIRRAYPPDDRHDWAGHVARNAFVSPADAAAAPGSSFTLVSAGFSSTTDGGELHRTYPAVLAGDLRAAAELFADLWRVVGRLPPLLRAVEHVPAQVLCDPARAPGEKGVWRTGGGGAWATFHAGAGTGWAARCDARLDCYVLPPLGLHRGWLHVDSAPAWARGGPGGPYGSAERSFSDDDDDGDDDDCGDSGERPVVFRAPARVALVRDARHLRRVLAGKAAARFATTTIAVHYPMGVLPSGSDDGDGGSGGGDCSDGSGWSSSGSGGGGGDPFALHRRALVDGDVFTVAFDPPLFRWQPAGGIVVQLDGGALLSASFPDAGDGDGPRVHWRARCPAPLYALASFFVNANFPDAERWHAYLFADRLAEAVRRHPFDRAARVVQAAWREAVSDPGRAVCRRRLMREFEGLGEEAAGGGGKAL